MKEPETIPTSQTPDNAARGSAESGCFCSEDEGLRCERRCRTRASHCRAPSVIRNFLQAKSSGRVADGAFTVLMFCAG
jgi:hypothetical protein